MIYLLLMQMKATNLLNISNCWAIKTESGLSEKLLRNILAENLCDRNQLEIEKKNEVAYKQNEYSYLLDTWYSCIINQSHIWHY